MTTTHHLRIWRLSCIAVKYGKATPWPRRQAVKPLGVYRAALLAQREGQEVTHTQAKAT
jgi:hypothetical protein